VTKIFGRMRKKTRSQNLWGGSEKNWSLIGLKMSEIVCSEELVGSHMIALAALALRSCCLLWKRACVASA